MKQKEEATVREQERLATDMLAKRLLKDNEARLAREREAERMKERENKLFFGGIVFADLVEKFNALLEEAKEPTTPTSWSLDSLKAERASCFIAMISEFGRTRRIKPNWEKRYCHVVYEDKDDACRAFAAFSSTEERKLIAEEMRKRAQTAHTPSFVVPLPTFYVRWPKKPSPGKKGAKRGHRNDKGCRARRATMKNRKGNTEERKESVQAPLLYWEVTRSGDWSKLNREDSVIVQKEEGAQLPVEIRAGQEEHRKQDAAGPKGRAYLVGLLQREAAFAVEGGDGECLSPRRLPLICSAA